MIQHITFSDTRMTISAQKCSESAKYYGADETEIYEPKFYESKSWDYYETFSLLNSEILQNKRGCGYWLWKPLIIANAMEFLHEGDILIYTDAGIEIIAPLKYIIDRMDEDIFLFSNGFKHVEWCKGDVLNTILPYIYKDAMESNHHGYIPHNQVQASAIFFRINQKTKDFVKEWLLYCQMPRFIDDSPSKLANYPTFAEHRHDQAILTCLQIKYEYKLHWYPTIYANHLRAGHEQDDYPALFNHHRKRNPGTGDGQPEW